MKKVKVLKLLIVTMIICVACQSTKSPSEQLDFIFKSTSNCSPSCWQTIVPGQSSEVDFLELVNTLDFDDLRKIQLRPEGIQYGWINRIYNIAIHINVHNSQVESLGFQLINSTPSFIMFKERLGIPDFYHAKISGIEEVDTILLLMYEDQGIILEIRFPATQDILTSCEFVMNSNEAPKSVQIYFVEANAIEIMTQNYPMNYPVDPSQYIPQPWTDKDALKVSDCLPTEERND